jgi:FlaG/FlaF family flagellin (archaellin)
MGGQVAAACRTRHSPRRGFFSRDAAGVTPLVGTILILGIAVAGLAVVMTWGLPALKQTQADAELAGVLHQFETMEELAENVMRSGGVGKANEATLSFTEGQVQRVAGTEFLIAVHLEQAGIPTTENYTITAVPGSSGYTVTVRAHSGVDPTARWVDAHTVTTVEAKLLASRSDWTANALTFGLTRDQIDDGTLRLRVMGTVNGQDTVITEAWAFPAGALEYMRHTPFGEVRYYLEGGSVITTYESGSNVHTFPLVRLERQGDDPAFFGFFAQRLVASPEHPGLESAGPGGHPIRLALQENALRASGVTVRAVNLQASGERGALWEEFYKERYTFQAAATLYGADGAGVVLPMAEKDDPQNPGQKIGVPFQFVLMESRVELSLIESGIRLDV